MINDANVLGVEFLESILDNGRCSPGVAVLVKDADYTCVTEVVITLDELKAMVEKLEEEYA